MNHTDTETQSKGRGLKGPQGRILLLLGLAILVGVLVLLRRSGVTIRNGDGDFQVSSVELKEGPVFSVYYPDRLRYVLKTVLSKVGLARFAPPADTVSIPVREKMALYTYYFSKSGRDYGGGPITLRVKGSQTSSQQLRVVQGIWNSQTYRGILICGVDPGIVVQIKENGLEMETEGGIASFMFR